MRHVNELTFLIAASTLSSGMALASTFEATVDWRAGYFPGPAQEFSGNAGWAILESERVALGASGSVTFTDGFGPGSSDIVTGTLEGALFWRAKSAAVPVLLIAEPFLIYRFIDMPPGLVLPGATFSLERLTLEESFALSYLHEVVAPAKDRIDTLRGVRQIFRATWKPRSLAFGAFALRDSIFQYWSAGPELTAAIEPTAHWRCDLYARLSSIGTHDSNASLRVTWRQRSKTRPHFSVSRSANPVGTEWATAAGVTWSAH